MALGDSVRLAVYRAVVAVGDPATLSRADKSYDPINDTEVVDDEDTWSVHVTPPDKMKTFEVPNTAVQAGDLKLLLPAYELEEAPEVGWQLTHMGRSLRIVSVDSFTLTGMVLGYLLECKK